jgi:hypothetical protein
MMYPPRKTWCGFGVRILSGLGFDCFVKSLSHNDVLYLVRLNVDDYFGTFPPCQEILIAVNDNIQGYKS